MCIYTKYIDIVVNIVIVTKVISGKYDFMWLCIAVDVAPCPYPDQSRGGCAWPPSLGFIGWATRLRRSSRGRRLLLVASAFTGGGSFQPGVNEPGNNKSKTGQIEPKTLGLLWCEAYLEKRLEVQHSDLSAEVAGAVEVAVFLMLLVVAAAVSCLVWIE